MTITKEQMDEAKRNVNLHILSIQFQEGLTKPEATAKAWMEGPNGLKVRMKLEG